MPSEVDVLVVGLGPVGAMLAHLLARHGVSVMAIDKARRSYQPDVVQHYFTHAHELISDLRLLLGASVMPVVAVMVNMAGPLSGSMSRMMAESVGSTA
ncbi:FAD-dependent monooxygenase [Ralstonia mannitolilytica]|uniref:FAD-dependent monooxygenase n=1 Tax=Ralstonia mannitolilytica TaxID=105219 RepID=UPI0037431C2D